MLRKNAKIELLKRVPLFARCTRKQLDAIALIADPLSVPTGTTLIHEGTKGREFMVIVTGEIEVRRKGRKLTTLGPGDFVGEMALLSGGPRNATVTTTEATSLLVISDRRFWDLLETAPAIQTSVLKSIGERLQPTAV